MSELSEQIIAGDRRSVARGISQVEDGRPEARDTIAALTEHVGRAAVVGLTGPPGAGKSTLTGALVGHLRGLNMKVAVLAVDPSSPFTGGALLGDRLRMQDHATDNGVFIRSMASRGALGGLAVAVPHAIRILDAADFDVVLLETVGVGQAEVEVSHSADTTVVVLAPGMGDSVQANKAGVLEIADVFAINKADRPEAKATHRDITQMLHLGAATDYSPPVVLTSATEGDGISELWDKIMAHRAFQEETGGWHSRRVERIRHEIAELSMAQARAKLLSDEDRIEALASKVAAGDMDPYDAAAELLHSL